MENTEEKVSWIVKWYEKYGRNPSWIVKRYEKYGRKVSWKVKRYEKYGSWKVKKFGKCRRKLWEDMKNIDEMWNDMENMEESQVE